MVTLVWLILGIPLAAAALIFFVTLQRPKLSAWLVTGGMMVNFLLTCVLAAKFPAETLTHHPLESSVTWMRAGGFSIEFGILLNGLSLLMLFVVNGVGSLIFLYSTSYMKGERGYSRYFASLGLFAFSMLGIVLSNNLIGVFIFWELVGLSSYLLIGFWFEKPSAAVASKKAFLTTRVGDVGMILGILLLFGELSSRGLGTFNFLALETAIPQAGLAPLTLTWIAMLIFCGVAGKSGQVPLHVWLPDAMEGPTPVSALIHAATMVAAGVFLLARFFFLFEASPAAMRMIAWIGVLTAFLPATIALVQNDIKKILAYSTLSQLGYMVMAIGLGGREAGMFHLTTHAFFKALLFLGAGSLIHGLHSQNIWEMRSKPGTLKSMPWTSFTFLIGTIALMGIPPFSGFYSKEEILMTASHGPKAVFFLALAVVFLTSFYMGRLCTLVFFNQGPKKAHGPVHESGPMIVAPLGILAVFSVIGGFLPVKALLESGHTAAPHGGQGLAMLSIGIAGAGFVAAFLLFRKAQAEPDRQPLPVVVLERKYFFDDLYDALIRLVQENLARAADFVERQAVVRLAVNGTASVTRLAGRTLTRLQTGMVQFYALVFSAGVTVLLFLLMLKG